MPAETAQAICCMIFGGVLERYPRLKVCFAHGGIDLFYQVHQCLHEGKGTQIGEITCGGSPHLSCKHD